MTSKIQAVKKLIDSISPLSETSFKSLSELLAFESYPKGTVFIERGKRNTCEYFVLSGICKSFLISPEGDEITLSFFVDQSILSPHTTRINQQFSLLNFKALNTIELASVNASRFEQLMVDNLEIRNWANQVLRNELIQMVNKEIGLAALTAKERLIEFRKQFPNLENLIPHPDIASYLGITNISLSRLRKELMLSGE